jgi:hypothetical protein
MNHEPERMRAGRVAALAVKSGMYPSIRTAIEVIPCMSLANEADDLLQNWIYTKGGHSVEPERLALVLAEFIGACVQADVDPLDVIHHLPQGCRTLLKRWRDLHEATHRPVKSITS